MLYLVISGEISGEPLVVLLCSHFECLDERRIQVRPGRKLRVLRQEPNREDAQNLACQLHPLVCQCAGSVL